MRARFSSRCVCGLPIEKGQEIKRTGKRWAHVECARDMDPQTSDRRTTTDDAEYLRGMTEVAEIQAISAPGSALREALYLEMEQAAWSRGEDY